AAAPGLCAVAVLRFGASRPPALPAAALLRARPRPAPSLVRPHVQHLHPLVARLVRRRHARLGALCRRPVRLAATADVVARSAASAVPARRPAPAPAPAGAAVLLVAPDLEPSPAPAPGPALWTRRRPPADARLPRPVCGGHGASSGAGAVLRGTAAGRRAGTVVLGSRVSRSVVVQQVVGGGPPASLSLFLPSLLPVCHLLADLGPLLLACLPPFLLSSSRRSSSPFVVLSLPSHQPLVDRQENRNAVSPL
ncbi:uncharacterized protein RHOBADRAFT_65910, partial [Rhodotorula graminis WP1]